MKRSGWFVWVGFAIVLSAIGAVFGVYYKSTQKQPSAYASSIAKASGSDSELALKVVGIFEKLGGPRSSVEISEAELKLLQQAVRSESSELRFHGYTALACLSRSRYSTVAQGAILAMKDDPDDEIRRSFYAKMVHVEHPQAKQYLDDCIRAGDPSVQSLCDQLLDKLK